MTINWSVRLRNKSWWLAIIPAICVLVQTILQLFGITWDYQTLVGYIAAIIEAVFAVLILIGVNVDPTTDDWSDSARALNYVDPAPNVKEQPEPDAAHMAVDTDD